MEKHECFWRMAAALRKAKLISTASVAACGSVSLCLLPEEPEILLFALGPKSIILPVLFSREVMIMLTIHMPASHWEWSGGSHLPPDGSWQGCSLFSNRWVETHLVQVTWVPCVESSVQPHKPGQCSSSHPDICPTPAKSRLALPTQHWGTVFFLNTTAVFLPGPWIPVPALAELPVKHL